MNLLPWTIYLSMGGAALAFFLGRYSARAARWTALCVAAVGLALVLVAAMGFEPSPEAARLVDVPWIPQMGIRYHLCADGVSLTLVLLTGIAATAGVLFSWNIEERVGDFFAFYLTLIGGVYGVFLSSDLFLFFVFYELAIVPKYFLIATWGSSHRGYGAMKLVLYSFAGSTLVLFGLLWAYVRSGSQSFDLGELAASASHFSHSEQVGMFGLVFFGFAVLAGLVPFHTWAPTGHVAAPTGASMLLAGVVMKLGAYGCLRVAMPLFPQGFAYWQTPIAWLAVIGVVYAGLIALVQNDFKFVIGYSSVSHMGLVMLGLAAANLRSVSGAVLQMFSHGIVAGLLFAVAGRMVYDRTHTRSLAELARMPLARMLPFAATLFVIAGLASMGMPGFSGFPAELSILVGAWKVRPVWAVIAAAGVLVAAAFTLRAIHLAFFGRVTAGSEHEFPALPPTTFAERAGAFLLLLTTVVIGLKPDLLLNWIVPSLGSSLMHAVIQGGHP